MLSPNGEPEATHSVQVSLHLIAGQNASCARQDKSCGSFSTFKTCVSGCGLGSGGSDRCVRVPGREGSPVRKENKTTSKRCRFDVECRQHVDFRATFESNATCKRTNYRHRCRIYIVSMSSFCTGWNFNPDESDRTDTPMDHLSR